MLQDRRMLLTGLFPLIFFVLQGLCLAQQIPSWQVGLDAAIEKARSEKKPLLISMHLSSEIACQRMLRNIYTDEDVLARLADFVVVPTCFDRHKEEERDVNGTRKTVSTLFKTLSCADLRQNEKEVREEFFETQDVKVPNHIFVGLDGKIYLQKIYELKKADFLKLLDRALVLFGNKVVRGLEKESQALFKKIRRGGIKQKKQAVRAIVELGDEEKMKLLYMTIQGLKKDEERGACVRALGSDAMKAAEFIVLKWLHDRSTFVRNCAVVTLEEMRAQDAAEDLLSLHQRTSDKEKELRKDILRAFGPCAGDEPKAREILLAHVNDRWEPMRLAALMSLGSFLDDEDVQKTLADAWRKAGKAVAPRTAILYAYMNSRDASLIPQLTALVGKEKNHQILMVAKAAKARMKGQQNAAGDRKQGRGAGRSLRKAFSVLYSKDRIVRRAAKRR